MKKIIFYAFAVLTFFVPLILWPFTSEVFEFNKMVLTYAATSVILACWIIRSISEKKIIFRRTILDIPLAVFILSQFISTLVSIDPQTSWLGYYSRFNGGFVSVVVYALLYWAFVSNLDKKNAKNLVKIWLMSATMVSIYGVLEHFGIDKNIWVQDVQSRVFSTLGQPNWLAAFLAALLPLTWLGFIKNKGKWPWLYFSLSTLFFWTLIFTKSRSGYLATAVAFVVFWGFNLKKYWKKFLIIGLPFFLICLISGTEYTPSIGQIIAHQSIAPNHQSPTSGTALETGGTESGIIRKIVWSGAIDVWRNYPIFGTGVETFAYSYYQFRPVEHNLVSEWDFIYNKAHNEYLNFAANTGTVGLASYLTFIGFTCYLLFKNKKYALFAGTLGLLVSNFFGFSVVPTQLELFLFPALGIAMSRKTAQKEKAKIKIESVQKVFVAITIIATIFIFYSIYKYWYADLEYSYGKSYNSVKKPDTAIKYLQKAIEKENWQPKYYDEIANSYAMLAQDAVTQKESTVAGQIAKLAITEENKVNNLSPNNILFKISEFGIYVRLTPVNPNYLINARGVLTDAINLAPTYAKLYYNLGLIDARIGQTDEALKDLKKAVDLKTNYKDARLAYSILLIDQKNYTEARNQLNYILGKIDPNDSLTKSTLESIK